MYSRHLNWTICSLFSRFCPNIFPPIYLLYWEVQFLIVITPERGSKEAAGAENVIHSKVNETQGFLYLGPSICNIFSLLSKFYSKKYPPFPILYWEVHRDGEDTFQMELSYSSSYFHMRKFSSSKFLIFPKVT